MRAATWVRADKAVRLPTVPLDVGRVPGLARRLGQLGGAGHVEHRSGLPSTAEQVFVGLPSEPTVNPSRRPRTPR
jgi:hypothetical protein